MEKIPPWKEAFPVSWPDDHYVTRREFTKSLALVSCAAFAANAALVAFGALERKRAAGPFPRVLVARAEELATGDVKRFDYAGEPCLLIRLDDDRFVAFGRKCTHLGCPVLYRRERQRLHCPCHEGHFDAADGRVLAGPPPRPLPRVDLERKGDELWATGLRA